MIFILNVFRNKHKIVRILLLLLLRNLIFWNLQTSCMINLFNRVLKVKLRDYNGKKQKIYLNSYNQNILIILMLIMMYFLKEMIKYTKVMKKTWNNYKISTLSMNKFNFI